MVLDESKLCYGHEIRFGQAVSCKIQHPHGGINLDFSHCGGTTKKQKVSNMRGFLKIECYYKKRSLSFTFYRRSIRHGGNT
jgi:hypothetical protein